MLDAERKSPRPRAAILAAIVVALLLAAAIVIGVLLRPRIADASRELPDAVTAGDFTRVAELLEEGADVDTIRPPIPDGSDFGAGMSHSMLSLAIRLRHADVARLLLRHGADPNGDVPGNDRQPLFWAAYTFDEKLFDALVKAGADIDFELNGSTAYEFAEGKYDNVANFLREKGAKTE